jgi:hypothetical protein
MEVQAVVCARFEYHYHLQTRSVSLGPATEHCVIEAIAKMLKVP